jgi:hypothetical protein
MKAETGVPDFIQACADSDARYHEAYRVVAKAADDLSADQKERLVERLTEQLRKFWEGRAR